MFDVSNDEAAKRSLMLRREHDATVTDLPERRLMVALFGDAIRCIEKYRNARDTRSKTRLAKELQWVLSDDSQSLFAFVRVCEVLDLDPLAVRRSLGLLGDSRGSRSADGSAETDGCADARDRDTIVGSHAGASRESGEHGIDRSMLSLERNHSDAAMGSAWS